MKNSIRPALIALLGLLPVPHLAAQDTLKVFLLLGQSNMEGQAYVFESSNNWNIPTMEFLLSGTAAAVNYRDNLPFGFEPNLNPTWLEPRSDVWCVHYNSGNGTLKNVRPAESAASIFNGIGPLGPGFGVGTGGSMFGPELAMGIRLGEATSNPVFLFKSDLGGTTLGNDWRPPAAVTARGGSVGVNYTNSITRFLGFLDDLDADLGDDGMLNAYNNATSYEVSGVFWFQGFNEPLSGGDGPYTAAQLIAEYQANLVDLIRSIRAEDSRIPNDLGMIIAESSDQNATLNMARIAAVAELNAEIPNSAAYFDINGMIGTNRGNNENGVPFTTDYGYHFNVRAENFLEIGWRAGAIPLALGWVDESPLTLRRREIASLDYTRAEVGADINANADAVMVYCATTDHGATSSGWTHTDNLGAWTGGPARISTVLNGLAAGTTYVVRFHATSTPLAAEAWSEPVSFTTPALTDPPALATPVLTGIFDDGAAVECHLAQAPAEVTLVWAHSDQGETNISTWTGAAGGGSHALGATSVYDLAAHTITGLAGDTAFACRFFATNANGDTWSEPLTFTTGLGGSPAPANLTVVDVTQTTVELSWTGDYTTATSFLVRRSTTAGFTSNVTDLTATADATAHTDNAVVPGVTYYYKVAGRNAAGIGPFSEVVIATTDSLGVPLGDPVVHWKLDETNGDYSSPTSGYVEEVRGSTVTVETPSGGTGITEGTPALAPGGGASARFQSLEGRSDPDPDSILAGSIDTSGVHASGQAQIGSPVNLGKNYTITAWLKPQIITDTIGRTICGSGLWNNDYNALSQQGSSLRIGSGDRTVSLSNVLALDRTVFVAGLVNNSGVPDRPTGTLMTVAVFVPSTATWHYADGTGTAKMNMKLWNMTIGAKIIGEIDDVRVYDHALTHGELAVVAFDDGSGGSGGGGFSDWAGANLGGQGITDDFNGDGVENGIAYFTDDTGVITLPGVVGGAVTWTNGGNIPASAYGTEFVIETSPDLDTWTPVDAGDLDANTDGPGGSLTYTLPTGTNRIFARLAVTPN
jgi:hypothetical protein